MHEQKNKDIKAADKKNLDAIKSMIAQNSQYDATMRYVLDSMMQLLRGKTSATYASEGQTIFADEKTYGENVRKCKPEILDKGDLQSMAERININSSGKAGDIAESITDHNQPQKYLHFFCHFKVLFKLVQIGLSVKKMVKLQKEKAKYGQEILKI